MSDLTIDSTKFSRDAVGKDSQQFLALLRSGNAPRDKPWWEIGIEEYRRREASGELRYQPHRLDHRVQTLSIPSRDAERYIPCRAFVPISSDKAPKVSEAPPPSRKRSAVFSRIITSLQKDVLLFIHGGGWSVFSNAINDTFLAHIADKNHLAVVSVAYRRAPEFPYPQGPNDCYDAAEWLVDHAEPHFGAPLTSLMGSSSGAHFAALTAFHLRKSRPAFHLRSLMLNYGIFDLTYSNPSLVNAPQDALITTTAALKFTTEAFVPHTTRLERQSPDISPFYADLQSLAPLPPALIICGTEDILIDDSVFFAAKYLMAGADAVLKVFPGAVHGFMDFEAMAQQEDGWREITAFIASH
ncbi:hypothetical protein BP5796_02036 [Coleophoma crateriformis]|uniref:Alpha/beta hydrolase fold-3 domain-containing protein n=1 Tax=Coleophoma crateriformis TaxID=565419 RepID=A0A3D8T240_9HELO|nr:hypothetical protein BP5796_02036 [Coleophoma crateriformis]